MGLCLCPLPPAATPAVRTEAVVLGRFIRRQVVASMFFSEVMLMEEIPNNPPGVYETLYIYHINWCRISAIKRIFTYIYISSIICYSLLPCSSVSLTVGSLLFGSVLGSGQEWIICRHEMDAHTHMLKSANQDQNNKNRHQITKFNTETFPGINTCGILLVN